jgi:hypothetical protein
LKQHGTEAPKDGASSKASPSLAAGGNRFGFCEFPFQEPQQKKFHAASSPVLSAIKLINGCCSEQRAGPLQCVQQIAGPASDSMSAISVGCAKT